MIRILQITSSLAKNGTETFIMNVFRALDRNEYMFDFLVNTDSKDGYYDEVRALGGKIFFIPPRKKNPLSYHKALNDFFSTHSKDYDAVHYNGGSLTEIEPLFYAKKFGIPKRIVHIHMASCSGLHNRILHHLNSLIIGNVATCFLGCSRSAIKWGFKMPHIRKKAVFIPNGIDQDRFAYDNDARLKIRNQLGLSDNLVIGHIGMFDPIKNHSFLVKIFNILSKSIPDARLLLVGDGKMMDETESLVKTYNLSDKVIFTGRRSDIPDLLSAMDIIVMPSISEGLAISLLEAQASGLPVVASTGIPDETVCSTHFQRIPLSEKPEYWAKIIAKNAAYKRIPLSDRSELYRFDISNTVRIISGIYQNR